MIENAAIGLRKASLFIILLTVFGLILGLLSNNVANADDLPVIHVSGTLGANETWSAGSVYVLDSTVTVPNGVTLTINNGAIVKFPYGYWVHGITVSQGGTLDVNGTSTSSVIFTSLRDDAAGGDSGSDGATS